MEVPEGWAQANDAGAEESLSWTVVSRLRNVRVGVSLLVRGADENSDSFHVSIDGNKRLLNNFPSTWQWTSPLSFTLASAGEHTLKVMLAEDGSRVAGVKLVPETIADDFPVWFAQTDPDSFTTGMLTHDASGKCMVRL